MSNPNTDSVFPNDVLLNPNITFCTSVFDTNALVIAYIINANDLFGNLGISFFSLSKNSFNPFFIPLFVI